MSDTQLLCQAIQSVRPELDAESVVVMAEGTLKLADKVVDEFLDISRAELKLGGDVRRKTVPLLGPELRKLRDRARMTQEQAVAKAMWSLSKLIRIEKNTVGVSPGDIRHILLVYGIRDEGRILEMTKLAKAHKAAMLHIAKQSRLKAAQRLANANRQERVAAMHQAAS